MDSVQPPLVRASLETLRPIVERLFEMGIPFGTLQLGYTRAIRARSRGKANMAGETPDRQPDCPGDRD
jgi:hypothetical protein